MLIHLLSLLGLGKWADSLSEKMHAIFSEGANGFEARVLLAKLELQEGRRVLLQAIVLLLICAVVGFVLLMFSAIALVVQFWDTPYRMTVTWGLVFVLAVLFIGTLVYLLRTIRKSKRTFELTMRELNKDWETLKERFHE